MTHFAFPRLPAEIAERSRALGDRLHPNDTSAGLMPIDFAIGDVIRLHKPHPCGSFDWTVVRIGADIGLRCEKCGRRLMLDRSLVERRFKTFITRPQPHQPFGGADALQGLEPSSE